MTPDTEEIFHQASALASESERLAYVEQVCADQPTRLLRLVELLRADAKAGSFLREPPEMAETEGPGDILGRYELIRKVGEGGFGVVFEARQSRPDAPRVALKIVKAGMDTRRVLRRFAAEHRVLAKMSHPHIACVFDAGSTGTGRPYFVMEFVDGVPITEYADQHRLSIPERLELLRQVCSGVLHAHQKMVVHRDLKPSNVLITQVDGKPVPKVIDFGIAKAISDDARDFTEVTIAGLTLGTPQYMSPEQAGVNGSDVDGRADVYALGVLLFELLTGTTPLEQERLQSVPAHQIPELIGNLQVSRPSSRVLQLADDGAKGGQTAEVRGCTQQRLAKLLAQDLDWIVLKALDQDRRRRYDTVADLSEDLRRYLDNEPVVARPPSTRYRLQKFVRRNSKTVLAGSALAVALMAGVAGTSIGLHRATAAKARLFETNVALDRMVDFQLSNIRDIDPMQLGLDLRNEILESARQAMQERGQATTEVAAEIARLQGMLASSNFTTLALDVMVRPSLGRTQEVIDGEFSADPVLQAKMLQRLASTFAELGLLEQALSPQQLALQLRENHLGSDHSETLLSLARMASLRMRSGELQEAESLYMQVAEGRSQEWGPEHSQTLDAIHDLGGIVWRQGRLDEARVLFEQALTGYQRIYPADHKLVLTALNSLGAVHEMDGQLQEAEACYQAVFDGFSRNRGHLDPGTLVAGTNLSRILQALGRTEEAEKRAHSAWQGMRELRGDNHPETLTMLNGWATILYAQQRFEEVVPWFEFLYQERRRSLGMRHLDTMTAMGSLAATLRAVGQLDRAKSLALESVELARSLFREKHWAVAIALVECARTLGAREEFTEAESLAIEGYEMLVELIGEASPRAAKAAMMLSDLYQVWHEKEPELGLDEEAFVWQERAELAES